MKLLGVKKFWVGSISTAWAQKIIQEKSPIFNLELRQLFIRTGEMDFKVERPWNTEKFYLPPWLAGKKNFLNSRLSRIAKTVTF